MITFEKHLGGHKRIVSGKHEGWVLLMPNGQYGIELSKDEFYAFDKETSKKIKTQLDLS